MEKHRDGSFDCMDGRLLRASHAIGAFSRRVSHRKKARKEEEATQPRRPQQPQRNGTSLSDSFSNHLSSLLNNLFAGSAHGGVGSGLIDISHLDSDACCDLQLLDHRACEAISQAKQRQVKKEQLTDTHQQDKKGGGTQELINVAPTHL